MSDPITEDFNGLPAVGGRTLSEPINVFERRCRVHLMREQEGISPDNGLIALLCDAVRLAREYGDTINRPIPIPPAKFATPNDTITEAEIAEYEKLAQTSPSHWEPTDVKSALRKMIDAYRAQQREIEKLKAQIKQMTFRADMRAES